MHPGFSKSNRCMALCAGLLVAILVFAGEAFADPPAVALEIVNEGGKSLTLSAAELARLPQKQLKAKDHKGDEATYSGVLMATVLEQTEAALGERLRGKALTGYLVVEAADKYRVLFSLPEIDPESTDNVVLLALSRNGEPLDKAHGPLQLVVPTDKRHARWVKQVVRLVIRNDSK